MKKGKGWVFTPNKREFIKIFSSLNKQAFGFSIIEKFLDHLDVVVAKIKQGQTVNEVVHYGFGEDKNGDGVLSSEGLSNKEKAFKNLTQNLKSLGQGELSNKTIKIFHLGKIVKVICKSKNLNKTQDWIAESDQIIEIDLKKGFPLLWLNFQKLNLLANNRIEFILKFKKDLVIVQNKLFIIDTRSSLKRAGGNKYIFRLFIFLLFIPRSGRSSDWIDIFIFPLE